MSLPRYAEYKGSGEAWLGEIPSHWDTRRLRRLFEIRKRIAGEEGHQVLSITQRGIKIKDIESNDGQQSMDYSKYQFVKPGDFAMNHMDLLTGYVDISRESGVTSPDYRVFAVREEVECEPTFFLHLFQNGYKQKIFYAFGQGASEFGRWRFPTDQFNDFCFPCPPPAEQAAIATFLDRETGKIDALIAEQEKLLTLLAEKRQATISHAVTRGLNPSAPMKDSGVPWLDEVPAHWGVTRLKFVASVQTGIAKGKDNQGRETITVPYLRVANVQDGHLALEQVTMIDIEPEQLDRYRLQVGDVLMNEGGDFDKLGRGAIWGGEIEGCIHQNHVFAVRPHAVSPQWLNQITSSRYAQFYFMGRSKQSTNLASISSTNIMELPILLPPDEEQATVLAFIEDENARLDALHDASIRAILLLKERRSALIASAVTGKIDVRGAMEAQAG